MRILVVDDNTSSADALARAIVKRGDSATALYDGASAIELIEEDPPDLVLTDLMMEPVDGMAVLRAARAMRPPVEVIVFTAYGAVDVAVEAMQLGARDFLTKPVTLDQVFARLDDMTPATKAPADEAFYAEAPASRDLVQTLERIAGVPSPVWLEGEIGAGRGHAAWALHRLSQRPGDFHPLDVARLDTWPSMGTAVLPNVDDLPPDLQRHLLRRLQHVPDALRLVSTAGPDAQHKLADGSLSSELFYKLGVIVLEVPPLRERVEDILPILHAALSRFASRYGRPAPQVRPEQERRLTAHSWPGNIRELLNLAERAVVLGSEALDVDVIRRSAPGLPRLEPGFSLSAYLETIERRILVEALKRTHGDRAEAGRLLGVERNTLRYKLNKYDLLER